MFCARLSLHEARVVGRLGRGHESRANAGSGLRLARADVAANEGWAIVRGRNIAASPRASIAKPTTMQSRGVEMRLA